ncbi:MAG: response regulator transcription factor [Desulfobacterales bacterium]|nr:response regulator transcription factor [Desulfobacterales bacterium]
MKKQRNIPNPKTIMVIDDHFVVRIGLKVLIDDNRNYELVGEADDAKKGLRLAKKLKPDIAIVDIMLPDMDGIVLTREILKELKNTRVVIVSAHEKIHYVKESFSAGALAYMIKGADPETFYKCLDYAVNGKRFIDPTFSNEIYEVIFPDSPVNDTNEYNRKHDSLTLREQEVLRLIIQDVKLKDISERLHIAYRTVINHKSNIVRKFGFEESADLTRYLDHVHDRLK